MSKKGSQSIQTLPKQIPMGRKKDPYWPDRTEKSTYRVPLNDLLFFKLLNDRPGWDVIIDPTSSPGLYKVTLFKPGNEKLPPGLGRYKHDFKAWKSMPLGRNDGIEYKIISVGGRKGKWENRTLAKIQYRGTTSTCDSEGYNLNVPVEATIVLEEPLPSDPELREKAIVDAIYEDVEWQLEKAMDEHLEWFDPSIIYDEELLIEDKEYIKEQWTKKGKKFTDEELNQEVFERQQKHYDTVEVYQDLIIEAIKRGEEGYVGISKAQQIPPQLPKDLTQMTQKQYDDTIKYLSKLSMKELRKRQNLTKQQIQMAIDQDNRDALINLQVMERYLQDAIGIKNFEDFPTTSMKKLREFYEQP